MNLLKIVFCLALCQSAQAQIVNIDAVNNQFGVAPVTVFLTAGTYTIDVIGIAQGGAYDAWHFINGNISGCDGGGLNCTEGWLNRYRGDSVALANPISERGLNEPYESPALALANAVGTSFVLLFDADVDFSIVDSFYGDNQGGMSLSINAVPLPGALLVFLSGLLGVFAVQRRRVIA